VSILGSGLNFPYQPKGGKLETAGDAESVEAAIRMLFATRRGSRFMLPDYGSDIPELLFQPVDQNTALLLEMYAREAIFEWIPRVKTVNTRTTLRPEDHRIDLNITYTLTTDPTVRMMIYPLYVQQG